MQQLKAYLRLVKFHLFACAGAIVFILSFALHGHALDDPQSILKDLQNKASKIKTMEGSLVLSGTFTKENKKKETFKASGKIFTVSPDRFRLNLSADIRDPDREAPVKFNTEVVLDGKTLWLNVNNPNGKSSFLSSFDFVKLKEEFPDLFSNREAGAYYNPADQLKQLNETNVEVIGKTVQSGKECVILEGSLKRQLPVSFLGFGTGKMFKPSKVRVWVGVNDGVPYQTYMYNQSGQKAAVMQMTRVRLNQPLASNLFKFKIPEGATPIDMTPILEEEIRPKNNPQEKP